MSDAAKSILDIVISQVTGTNNPLTLEEAETKFAFDVRLPTSVVDALTGEQGWALSPAPGKFVRMQTSHGQPDGFWERPPSSFKHMGDLLEAWQEVNYTTTDRHLDSVDVYESDNVYNSENVHRSVDIIGSKSVLFSESVQNSEFVVACQRSNQLTYCLRVEDSKQCTASTAVSWSGKVVKSAFIHDCYDMYESLFCSHMTGKQYCIANRQFDKDTYFKIKRRVMKWLLVGE